MQLFDITPLPETGKSNEWFTPSKYIEAARSVMGSIDLDPASCELANRTVKATRYYTKEENGLALPWYGNVWCNPPYSKIQPWTKKLCQENITQAIFLLPGFLDTQWAEPLWKGAVCFKKGRIAFNNPHYHESTIAAFPSIFVYLGPHEQRFIDIFSQFGTIAKRVSQPKQPSHIQSVLDLSQS